MNGWTRAPLLGALVLAIAWAAGPASAADLVPRPTEGGEYAYSTPEAPPVVGAHAVVHYVTTGLDAPPLNDDNGNGVPDYVEEVSTAAETALGYYGSHGFKPAAADTRGPNSLTDIYIEHLPDPGLYGVTFAYNYASGGTFVILSSRLDQSPDVAMGSLDATVAHELFHVIQNAYVPNGRMPMWVAEGSASAMAALVYPDIHDVVMDQYLDGWLKETWRPLYDPRFSCNHCYGSAIWWWALERIDPALLPDYLGRLWGYQQAGKPLLWATQPLDEIFARHGYASLYRVFSAFSLAVYRGGLDPKPAYELTATSQVQATAATPVL